MNVRMLGTGAALLLGLVASPAALAQVTGGTRPPLVIESMAGSDLYTFYCASCHGQDGSGDGPAASALKAHPADLTALARRNGGTFPADRIRAVVTHGDQPGPTVHGSRDMPVWGPIFRALDPDDTRTRVRVDAIIEHVASLQGK